MICNAVKDQVSFESLTEMRRQINFRAKHLLSGNSLAFDSETEKLLSKPYRPVFWAHNACVMPDIKERKQITYWENGNLFYSENRLPPANETISSDSIAAVMNNNLLPLKTFMWRQTGLITLREIPSGSVLLRLITCIWIQPHSAEYCTLI